MAMVVRAEQAHLELGGHIATYASSATLYEIGFNHFWRAPRRTTAATWSTSRATPRPASTPAPFSKVA